MTDGMLELSRAMAAFAAFKPMRLASNWLAKEGILLPRRVPSIEIKMARTAIKISDLFCCLVSVFMRTPPTSDSSYCTGCPLGTVRSVVILEFASLSIEKEPFRLRSPKFLSVNHDVFSFYHLPICDDNLCGKVRIRWFTNCCNQNDTEQRRRQSCIIRMQLLTRQTPNLAFY